MKTQGLILFAVHFIPFVFFLLFCSFLFLELKYSFIEIVTLPKKISKEKMEEYVEKTKRKELTSGFKLWIRDSYRYSGHEDKMYRLKENISGPSLKKVSEVFAVYTNSIVVMSIFLTLFILQLVTTGVIIIIVIKARIGSAVFYTEAVLLTLMNSGVFFYGSIALKGIWP